MANQAGHTAGHSPNAYCAHNEGLCPSDKERASPSTAETDEWSVRRRDSQLSIHDLSFILHPSHEASTPDKDQTAAPSRSLIDQGPVLIARACSALGVNEVILEQM